VERRIVRRGGGGREEREGTEKREEGTLVREGRARKSSTARREPRKAPATPAARRAAGYSKGYWERMKSFCCRPAVLRERVK